MSHRRVLERASKAWYLPRDLRAAIAALLADLRITKATCDGKWVRAVREVRDTPDPYGNFQTGEFRHHICDEILRRGGTHV